MILRNSLNFIVSFFTSIFKQFRKIYLNSNYYDNKISKISFNNLIYKPSPHLLSSLIKYQTKKINIDDISTENLWDNKNITSKDFKKLNNFYWFFQLRFKIIKRKYSKNNIQLDKKKF